MQKLVWTDDMELGIPAVDNQHKHLIKIANKLRDSLLEGRDHIVINEILVILKEFYEKHIKTEEEIFHDHLEENEHHVREHLDFLNDLESFIDEPMADDVMNSYIMDYLFFHINYLDKEAHKDMMELKKSKKSK